MGEYAKGKEVHANRREGRQRRCASLANMFRSRPAFLAVPFWMAALTADILKGRLLLGDVDDGSCIGQRTEL